MEGNVDREKTIARLKRYGAIYAAAVVAVVVLANLGWVPGSGEPGQGLFQHPYRLSMSVITVILASSLGAWSAGFGIFRGGWMSGLAALFIGGILTGVALEFTPYILYPDDQYSVAFLWLMSGAPVGMIAWGAFTFDARMTGDPGAVAA